MRSEARSVREAAAFTRMEEEKLSLGERGQKTGAKHFAFQYFPPKEGKFLIFASAPLKGIL